MCNILNLVARINQTPGMMCWLNWLHARPYRRSVLPYMVPGRHRVRVRAEGRVIILPELRQLHACDCSDIILPSIVVGASSSDVTCDYRRESFLAERITGSDVAGMPGPLSPGKGGTGSSPAQQPEAPHRFEVWYQPSMPWISTASE